jgi:uncharacterized protein YggE
MNSDFVSDIFGNRGIRIASVAVLGFLALFLVVETVSVAKGIGRSANPATDVITVSGDGQATMEPDVARVSFTVEHTAPAVADAQAQTTRQTNEVLAFVKEQGVAEKDIKTISYNITPQYSYPNPCLPGALCPAYGGSPKVTGYQVSQSVQVTVRELTKVGDLLAGLGKLSVQNVSGPAFGLDDATAGYNAAREDAINKARAQAKVLSKQLGVRLGKIVNYSESSGGYNYPIAYGMGGMMESKADATPNIPMGENTYNASVSITYEIR